MHDYHKDWSSAKKAARLDDKLFKLKLGEKLDELNQQYKVLMKTGHNNWKPQWDKVDQQCSAVRKIVQNYRALVNKNGQNAQALKVLASIDENTHGHMLWDIALDMGWLYHQINGF